MLNKSHRKFSGKNCSSTEWGAQSVGYTSHPGSLQHLSHCVRLWEPWQIVKTAMDSYNVGFNALHLTLFFFLYLYFPPPFIFKAAHKAASGSVTRGLSVCWASRLGNQILLQWHNEVFNLAVAKTGAHTRHTVLISWCICVLETQGSLFTSLYYGLVWFCSSESTKYQPLNPRKFKVGTRTGSSSCQGQFC